MAGELITGDYQMEWRDVLLGPKPYGVYGVSGLGDLPSVITADRDRLRAHGQIPGDDFLSGRYVEVGLRVEGTSNGDTAAATAALSRVCGPGIEETPLVFQIPGIAGGNKARINARIRNKVTPVDLAYAVGIVSSRLMFYATDPRIYSDSMFSQTVNLPSGGGGLTWPATWPASWSPQVDSGSLFVPNDGDIASPWTARIDGPCVNPVVRNLTAGKFVGFNITLESGEWLTLDTHVMPTVVLNDSESRYYTIQAGSRWWDFEPGATELAFRASTSTAATLTVTSRSAWTS
jgi:hypothetical protein